MMHAHFLPLFPLALVVFPGEKLNLHIFEPRYQQLLDDCLEQDCNFGIPAFFNKTLAYGTEMKILKVVRRYDDGRADISCRGQRVFKITSYENPIKGKLYAGGQVEYLENIENPQPSRHRYFLKLVRELYISMNIVQEVEVDECLTPWDLGHRIGLSQQQEYELLCIRSEQERERYVIRHLERTIPVLREVERSRELIRQNGHFRHFDALDF
jgi:Lon protease-like protein